jgi:E3 ubiquitin-protein ligase synoviolin
MISYRPLPSLRYWMVFMGSITLTAVVIGNAFQQKQQFYPSIVYLSKSTISLAVLHIQAFVLVILLGKILCRVFFGTLRETEVEHLIERGWYVLTETCLAFTVFRDDFTSRFVAMFTILLLAKCFHWLLEDRIDVMERSLNISWIFHVRAVSLMLVLTLFDILFIRTAYQITVAKGASAQLVFGFEYSILLVSTWTICMKYIIHTIDLRTQNSLENKATYFLYIELVANGVKVAIYSMFMFIMVAIHTFPLFAIRPMYLALKAFKKATYDVILSRRAINYMNTMFTDADVTTLTDNICAVCREEMTSNLKKLPCNHVFHTNCLRSWFQRQQTCPTCRIDILRHESTINMLNNLGGAVRGANPRRAGRAPAANQGTDPNVGTGANTGTTPVNPTTPLTLPGSVIGNNPMFMIPPPAFNPLPNMEEMMRNLTDEELRNMEGQQRANVEARIECLTQIKTLLDAAVTQMNQYSAIMTSLEAGQTRAASSAPTGTSSSESPKKTDVASAAQNAASGDIPSSSAVHPNPPVQTETIGAFDESNVEDPTNTEELRKRRLAKHSRSDDADLSGSGDSGTVNANS